MRDVFEVVESLLISPVIESALREDIAKIYSENFNGYLKMAADETTKHAK